MTTPLRLLGEKSGVEPAMSTVPVIIVADLSPTLTTSRQEADVSFKDRKSDTSPECFREAHPAERSVHGQEYSPRETRGFHTSGEPLPEPGQPYPAAEATACLFLHENISDPKLYLELFWSHREAS